MESAAGVAAIQVRDLPGADEGLAINSINRNVPSGSQELVGESGVGVHFELVADDEAKPSGAAGHEAFELLQGGKHDDVLVVCIGHGVDHFMNDIEPAGTSAGLIEDEDEHAESKKTFDEEIDSGMFVRSRDVEIDMH